jgi:alkaline phosphatase D
MILDDHEIEDNWTQDRISDAGKHKLFNWAIGAYQSYQWSHGPRTWGRLLYYTFECAGYPVFVVDTRTQRASRMTKRG